MRTSSQVAAAACIAVFALNAAAQQANPVASRLEARKVVVAADGKESLVAAESARPGDVIEYTATYSNAGRSAVRNLEATLPIPHDTELVAGSARPGGARASLDASTFAAMPLRRKAMVGGREVESDVPLSEYRALRWSPAELGGGQSLTYSARVRVVTDRAPNTPAGKSSPQ